MRGLHGLLLGTCALAAAAAPSPSAVRDYNVVWNSPSRDCHGSMPLGNGDIGLNAWVGPDGDLRFYIAKTDAWDDYGRLVKVGCIRVHCDPPLAAGRPGFRQELDLETATLRVRGQDGAGRALRIALWCDALEPVIVVQIEAEHPVTVTAEAELWRTKPTPLPELECSDTLEDRSKPGRLHAPVIIEPDTRLAGPENAIGWYHRNRKSVGPALTMRIQGLSQCLRHDPLLHRCFGAWVTGPGARRRDPAHLELPPARSQRLEIVVLTRENTSSAADWIQAAQSTAAAVARRPLPERRAAHEAWWRRFWQRSWINVKSTKPTVVRLFPENHYPVRIGCDQGGGNRFHGRIARVSLFRKILSPAEIARLAAADRTPLPRQPDLAAACIDPRPGAALPKIASNDLRGPLSFEAWVRPEAFPRGGGRILDNITPGGADGFLLDTYPGNSLRLIVGHTILKRKNALPPGSWHHLAVTADPRTGEIRLYLDGAAVASAAVDVEDGAAAVSRGYALQRFIAACAGRGRYPIKFNGSLFTVPYPGKPGGPDYRRWGPGYWWQNTRLPYISMCASGDFDLMAPFFKMYAGDIFRVCRYRTRRYFSHPGAYFPECMYFWGAVFSATYGWTPIEKRTDPLQVSGWHKWEWVAGPELVWMMLDYYDFTRDRRFLQERLLPVANAVLRFFDCHYRTGPDGKLVMHPAQALETWWDCTNPMPEIAGLRADTARLLALPAELTSPQDRAFWESFRKKIPELPTREIEGKPALAPADRFKIKNNIENPELYAVFPFRLVAFEKDNRALGIRALRHRTDRGNFGWRQDDVFMAYLGLADEARKYLVGRARRHDSNSRFPAFWGPNYDWVPDQDHGSILMKTLQAMVLQYDGDTIFLLPAWPRDWDLDFKLHAPARTTVAGAVRNGRLVRLSVTPPERRKDLRITPPWQLPPDQ